MLCFYVKLQQSHLSHFRFHFPPLDHGVNFTPVTHGVSTFGLYVKLKSKFAKSVSEVNLVRNLNLFTLTKQTESFLIGVNESTTPNLYSDITQCFFVVRLPTSQS